jgi:uncharacterized protein
VEQCLEFRVDEECALAQIDEPDAYEVGADGVDAMPILDDDIIDLSELVRQNLVVNLPTAVLCAPACLGLCPGCGKNLNEGPCQCDTDRIDPRLAKLRELLDSGSSEADTAGRGEQ